MAVYEKIIFQAICLQNHIVAKYFKIDRSDLHFSFDSITGDDSDIDRLPNKK